MKLKNRNHGFIARAKTKIKHHLATHFIHGLCPVCRNDRWHIESELAVYLMVDHETMEIIKDKAIPMTVVSCEHCSYTLFFNVVKMGLV